MIYQWPFATARFGKARFGCRLRGQAQERQAHLKLRAEHEHEAIREATRAGSRSSYRKGFTTFEEAFDGPAVLARAINLSSTEYGLRAGHI